MKIGHKRLLKLAGILEKADHYDQSKYVHTCGAPACALGHWAAANPKRWKFSSSGMPGLKTDMSSDGDRREFGIPEGEWSDFFGFGGCGGATTGKQAARFIRKYVKRASSANGSEK